MVAMWMLQTLLKLGGVLAILLGLLEIALSNMDGTPIPELISGTVTIGVGLVLLYFGIKIAKIAKSA